MIDEVQKSTPFSNPVHSRKTLINEKTLNSRTVKTLIHNGELFKKVKGFRLWKDDDSTTKTKQLSLRTNSTIMKTLLLSLALIYSVNSYSQTTAIPDVNFEQALINLGCDNVIDGSVLTANISGVITLFIPNLNISNLTGIEDFTALTTLICSDNQLTSLDVSQNTVLSNLLCHYNQLTSLDISQNGLLMVLHCYNNQLTNLDVSQNTALKTLECYNNQLTNLDVSQNTGLFFLFCQNNQLISLDVSKNTALIILVCSNNQLTSLDVSKNTALTSLICGNNLLNCLNVKNGNNINFNDLSAKYNPSLTCIEVDDVVYSTTNWTVDGGDIDPAMSFSTNCNNACSVGIEELYNTPKQLLRIVDLMGRETEFKPNTPLIYIYSDGSSEKVFEVED